MKFKSRLRPHAGFTLTELLVVIVIIAVLASLVFVGAKRAIESAKIASNMSNLRNLGTMVNAVASDQGSYPPGWSWIQQKSWANYVVEQLHGEDVHQSNSLLSPYVASDIPPDLSGPTVTNYTATPFVFVPEYPNGRAWKVSTARLRRPAEQILLCDGLPRSKDADYGFTMVVLWDLINSGRAGSSGNPPTFNPQHANRVISWPEGIEEMTYDGSKGLPAFRYRGKCHFLFADGHVEALKPNELKYKNFAISY